MLIYDVYYPNSQAIDCGVPWSYLARLAKSKENNGCKSVCLNGEAETLILVNCKWVDETEVKS